MKITNATTIYLQNPWSGARSSSTWGEIQAWAKAHVHPNDLRQWLNAAKQAAQRGDEKTLGRMVIGS